MSDVIAVEETPPPPPERPPRQTLYQKLTTKQSLLTIASCMSVVLGVGFGLIMRVHVPLAGLDRFWIYISGETLLHLFELISAPLILTNIITGICVSNFSTSRRLNMIAMIYFSITTIMALLTGFVLVFAIQPGNTKPKNASKVISDDPLALTGVEITLDLIRNLVPRNIMRATYQQYKTEKGPKTDSNASHTVTGINILGLIMLSVLTGIALRRMKKFGRGQGLLDLVIAVNMLTKSVVHKIMFYLPIGVLFLVASYMYDIGNDMAVPVAIMMFIGIALLGLFIHGCMTIPLIFMLSTRQNPFAVISVALPSLLKKMWISRNALAPQTYICCEEELQIDRRITRFMLPIGHSINMDGTALYHMAACVFIIQLGDVEMNWTQYFVLGLAVAVASIGDGGIPVTKTGTTFFILGTVGAGAQRASLLIIFEFFIDYVNAIINCLGDCIGVAIVEYYAVSELSAIDDNSFLQESVEPEAPKE